MEVPNLEMITPAMKRQLMNMSGITDMKEFDELVSKLAPMAQTAIAKDGGGGGSAAPTAGTTAEPNMLSPFQIHFLPIVTTIEGKCKKKQTLYQVKSFVYIEKLAKIHNQIDEADERK